MLQVRMNQLIPARFDEQEMPMMTDDVYQTFFDTKLKVLLAEITRIRETDATAKVRGPRLACCGFFVLGFF